MVMTVVQSDEQVSGYGGGITVRELCLAAILLTVVVLVTYPIARYYWIKGGQNAEVIRQWDEGYKALH